MWTNRSIFIVSLNVLPAVTATGIHDLNPASTSTQAIVNDRGSSSTTPPLQYQRSRPQNTRSGALSGMFRVWHQRKSLMLLLPHLHRTTTPDTTPCTCLPPNQPHVHQTPEYGVFWCMEAQDMASATLADASLFIADDCDV